MELLLEHSVFMILSVVLSYITNIIQKKSESLDDGACFNSYPRIMVPVMVVLMLLGPIGVICNVVLVFFGLLTLLYNFIQYTKHDNSWFSNFIKKLEGR